MKIYEIPDKTDVTLGFIFKNHEFERDVIIYAKKDETVYIPAICFKGEALKGNLLKNVTLSYTTDKGIYTFENLKLKLSVYDGLNLYAINCNYEAKRLNRRDAFRLFLGDTLNIRLITQDGKFINCEGIVRDISALGVGIILKHKVEESATFEVIFNQYPGYKTTIVCKIIRMMRLENNKGYIYGCRLVKESPLLTRFILDKQRQKNNKLEQFY